MTNEPTVAGPRLPKAERLLALAGEEYEPHRAARWPYLLRDGERFRFEGADRRRLLADLRAVWRERFPGQAAPAGRDLSAVADDLRRLAEQAEHDQAGLEDQAAELMEAHGNSAIPADRGLSLVTQLEDCPLPGRYVIPEPYMVAADGIHLSQAKMRRGGSSPGMPTSPPRSPRTGPTAPWRPGKTPSARPAAIWSFKSAHTRVWRPRCWSRWGSTRSPWTSPAGRPEARPSRRWSR